MVLNVFSMGPPDRNYKDIDENVKVCFPKIGSKRLLLIHIHFTQQTKNKAIVAVLDYNGRHHLFVWHTTSVLTQRFH